MIYEDLGINSSTFASLCRWWLLCRGIHGLGIICEEQPAIWAKDKVKDFPPSYSAEGEKTSYQHFSRICKQSSLGEIVVHWRLGVVINYLVMKVINLVKTAPCWHGQNPDRRPSLPANALSHLIRLRSEHGWLRVKRLQPHRWILVSTCHCSLTTAVHPPVETFFTGGHEKLFFVHVGGRLLGVLCHLPGTVSWYCIRLFIAIGFKLIT